MIAADLDKQRDFNKNLFSKLYFSNELLCKTMYFHFHSKSYLFKSEPGIQIKEFHCNSLSIQFTNFDIVYRQILMIYTWYFQQCYDTNNAGSENNKINFWSPLLLTLSSNTLGVSELCNLMIKGSRHIFSCGSNSIYTVVCLSVSVFCSQFLKIVNKTSNEARLTTSCCRK